MNTLTSATQRFIGLGLMAFMLATRFHHFGDTLHLPDASWAIFFIAGFYLPAGWLAGLMLLAIGIDAAAVGWLGVSGYCLTPAYAALQLAHAALWLGGRSLRGQASEDWRGLARFALTAGGAVLAAFIVSNTSFYWLGGQIAEPGLAEFGEQFMRYLPAYFGVNALYLGVAALLHTLLGLSGESRAQA